MATTEAEEHPGRRIGTIVATACIVLVLAGAAALFLRPRIAEDTVGSVPSFGGPFTLTTQTGARLSAADLKDKRFGAFFGFTGCPEVCPTTLWGMAEVLKTLGPGADRFKVLFITVDPTRDTPTLMARYLQSFDKHIVGLTGTEAEIATLRR